MHFLNALGSLSVALDLLVNPGYLALRLRALVQDRVFQLLQAGDGLVQLKFVLRQGPQVLRHDVVSLLQILLLLRRELQI